MTTHNKIRLTIQPLPDTPAAPDRWQRLRRFLKMLLRAYGWKAVRIEPVSKTDDMAKGDS